MKRVDPTAARRAQMPSGANGILDRRTMEHDNRNLLPLLRPGQRVLDVGCGSGTITKSIADRVGESGQVVGIDVSRELIDVAKARYTDVPQLTFMLADVLEFETATPFDLVTAARTLQWMSAYERALAAMAALAADGGWIAVLDYDHTRIEWSPDAPPSMRRFYDLFLKWRADAGMNNVLARDLPEAFAALGLVDISVTDESECHRRQDASFVEAAGIWKKVAELRGPQLVRDGYITEEARRSAIVDYEQWLEGYGQRLKMHLSGVAGRKRRATADDMSAQRARPEET
jgi:SAM-dependent methyltransferase